MEKIRIYLNSVCPLSKAAWKFLETRLVRMELKAGQVLLRPGETCTMLWFVGDGLLRSYEHFDRKQYCHWFMTKNDIATSVVSYFDEVPTEETVEALEDSVVFGISKSDLFIGLIRHRSLLMLTFLLTVKYYCQTRKMESALRKKSSAQLYDFLLRHYPELVGGLDNKYLATFMGIGETTLYNIKHEKKNAKPGKGD
jgi:CRP/FNR family transcriptional regulator, anaerobic regulatory protein